LNYCSLLDMSQVKPKWRSRLQAGGR